MFKRAFGAYYFQMMFNPRQPFAATLKLLIVDDNRQMRELTKTYLQDLAGEFQECEDGADALDCYKNFSPDWVLMDWEMKRLDGLAATRRIIENFPAAQILMVTQYDDDELRSAARDAGARGFILKENLYDLRRLINAA